MIEMCDSASMPSSVHCVLNYHSPHIDIAQVHPRSQKKGWNAKLQFMRVAPPVVQLYHVSKNQSASRQFDSGKFRPDNTL